ncbi:MAG: hypothetical protein U1E36_03405 [Rickettsiales bacterium]
MREAVWDCLVKARYVGLVALLLVSAAPLVFAETDDSADTENVDATQDVSDTAVTDIDALYPPEGDFTKNCVAPVALKVPQKDWTAWDGKSGAESPENMYEYAQFYMSGNDKIAANKITAHKLYNYVASTNNKRTLDAKIALARLGVGEDGQTASAEQIRAWANDALKARPLDAEKVLGALEERQENYTKAAEYYRSALKEGDPFSAFNLAKLHRGGKIPALDSEKPEQLIKLGQNMLFANLGKGDCTTLQSFGWLYSRSRAVPKNDEAALLWLEASIKANKDVSSMLQVADMYKAGLGTARDINKAVALWERAASMGSVRAMYVLGGIYEKGDGVALNLPKAIQWYEKAANLHQLRSIEKLATLYSDPMSGKQDPDKAFKWLSIASQHPDVDPAIWVKLGDAYAYGKGTPKNHSTAFSWYERAAKAGNTDGIFMLGEAYRYGRGVDQDIKRSLRFYRLAANLGNDDAIMLMAENYEKGIGVNPDSTKQRRWLERGVSVGNTSAQLELSKLLLSLPTNEDKQEAVSLIRKAAESGDKRSMVELSMLYQEGSLLEKSTDLARSWRERALLPGEKRPDALLALANAFIEGRVPGKTAKDAIPLLEKAVNNHNFAKAAYALGQLYHHGAPGVSVDLNKARTFYKIAAKENHAKSIEKLAETYMSQKPMSDAELRSAADYLEQASELGNAEAMRELGLLYVAGKGRPLNAQQGAFWLKRAANLGDLSAASELGELYLSGIGVERDQKEAIKYLTIAAEQGSPSAMRKLGRLYARGGAVENDPKTFILWMNKAAEAGDVSAMLEMANAYAAGFGVQESQERAVYWLEKAAGLGNEDAKQQLAVIEKKKD